MGVRRRVFSVFRLTVRMLFFSIVAGGFDAAGAAENASIDKTSHWSFQPVKRAQAPAVRDTAWARNDADRFILARLEKEGLKPSSEASRLVWLRRAYFTLTGLPPSPEQVKTFVGDQRPDAYERVVDEL